MAQRRRARAGAQCLLAGKIVGEGAARRLLEFPHCSRFCNSAEVDASARSGPIVPRQRVRQLVLSGANACASTLLSVSVVYCCVLETAPERKAQHGRTINQSASDVLA
jgi:hypothetical protein